jgi:hypothetical protein
MRFTPTVIKTSTEGEACYLVSYDDFCAALRISHDYWITKINDYGRVVEIKLIPKSALICNGGIIHRTKNTSTLTLRSKGLFVKQFGIEFDHFDAFIRRQVDEHTLQWLVDFPTPDAIIHPQELLVRFEADSMWKTRGGGIFTPEKTLIKRTY